MVLDWHSIIPSLAIIKTAARAHYEIACHPDKHIKEGGDRIHFRGALCAELRTGLRKRLLNSQEIT